MNQTQLIGRPIWLMYTPLLVLKLHLTNIRSLIQRDPHGYPFPNWWKQQQSNSTMVSHWGNTTTVYYNVHTWSLSSIQVGCPAKATPTHGALYFSAIADEPHVGTWQPQACADLAGKQLLHNAKGHMSYEERGQVRFKKLHFCETNMQVNEPQGDRSKLRANSEI